MNGKTMFYLQPVVAAALAQLECYEPAAGTSQPLVNPPFATAPSMFPLTTTLNRIKACNPCYNGWQAGLKAANKTKPDDESISYEAILDAVGIEKALWCCRAEKQYDSLWRRYVVWCARQVQHLMNDESSVAALDIAEQHANGEATDSELAAAKAAAWAAAGDAAGDARAAARAAAWAAAGDAWAAAWVAAGDAWAAAWVAAGDAAGDAAWVAQTAAFRQLVTTGTLPPVEQKREVVA